MCCSRWRAGSAGCCFFNPKLSGSDNDEEEYSLGLGFRVLCPAVEAIAGANVFYDSRDSRNGNTFDQVGAGVEVLTTWGGCAGELLLAGRQAGAD
jgi:hypothetical protein